MASRRPRRSRIYDSNYNAGESMYRSAISRLDEKYSSTNGTTTSTVLSRASPRISPMPERSPVRQIAVQDKYNFSSEADEELALARARASKAIHEETVLDTRTGRKALNLESAFDDQIQQTLARINASKKLLSSLEVENAAESSVSKAQSSIKKRSVKVTTDITTTTSKKVSQKEAQRASLTRWNDETDYNDSQSFAALRAKQSAQRIQAIDADITQRNERQVQREQRAANLKKLLSEGDYTSSLANGIASIKITKASSKITSC